MFYLLILGCAGLCCHTWAVPLFAFCLLLTAVASLVLERGLQGIRASAAEAVASLVLERGLQGTGASAAEAVASLVLERGLQGTRASAAEALWLSCSTACRNFLDPGPSPCPLHWLDHWTAGKSPLIR